MAQLSDFSTIGDILSRTMLAPCVTKWTAKQPEGLAHAIVYPNKTKSTGASKKPRRLVATQMHCDGNGGYRHV
jgi:hypothetical protein